MSGKMKANPGSGRTQGPKWRPSPLKSAALFGRTPRTCLTLAAIKFLVQLETYASFLTVCTTFVRGITHGSANRSTL